MMISGKHNEKSSEPFEVRSNASGHWWPFVSLFVLIYVISYIDRQILSIVVDPLKLSLGLSDFQIGLLQGVAFSLVLSVAAVLGAPLIDRGNRAHLLGTAMVIWCVMTVMCGLARSFEMLLMARTGLAIAEAIVPMAALSMIFDMVPRASVTRASALFMVSPFLGAGFALLFGGPLLDALTPYSGEPVPLVGALEAWRWLFLLLGIPGIAVGVLVFMFLPEPRRQKTFKVVDSSVSVIPFLKANVGFLTPLLIANAMATWVSYSIYAWSPSVMIRVYGMPAATTGITIGTIFVIAGTAGVVLGSWVMGRHQEGRELSHVLRMITISCVWLAAPLVAFPLVGNASIALALLAVAFFMVAVGLSSTLTPIALISPDGVRARALAVAGLIQAGFGGIGPLAVGAINDFVFKAPERIGDSVAICMAAAVVVCLLLYPRAVRLARAKEKEDLHEDARLCAEMP